LENYSITSRIGIATSIQQPLMLLRGTSPLPEADAGMMDRTLGTHAMRLVPKEAQPKIDDAIVNRANNHDIFMIRG
jgi:hypothetical protein